MDSNPIADAKTLLTAKKNNAPARSFQNVNEQSIIGMAAYLNSRLPCFLIRIQINQANDQRDSHGLSKFRTQKEGISESILTGTTEQILKL